MVKPARKSYVPDCGEIIWLVFDPQAGHEQAGRRPALVLSPKIYNQDRGLAVVCPITSKAKGFSYETPLPDGLEISGVVMADQIKSVDWLARKAKFACTAPAIVTNEVLAKIEALLQLNLEPQSAALR